MSFEKMVYAYTETSIGMFEALLVVGMKNTEVMIRPETVINQYIDENWKPALQTPPFPEYTSGHSVVSTVS
jgi:hypothetical protein